MAAIIISPTSTDGLTIGYRIEIVCRIGTLSTILKHYTYTMKPSDPLVHAEAALCCRMYPTGKVDICRHLATPGGEHKTDIYITETGTTELSHNIIDIFII